jgi:pullulanase/glycogen debranching enzyme
VYDRNESAPVDLPPNELLKSADLVRVGLAGSIRDFSLENYQGRVGPLSGIDYAGQPAGYVKEPGEVVNYVENHDNQTLYDNNVFKLPVATPAAERARVQLLGAAVTALSQGVAYFHAGIDILRSKSMDRNSFDSGDWFNRIDWTYRENYFGTGAPPMQDNGKDYLLIKPLLANPHLRPSAADIAWTRDAFRDLLRIRASSTLFRLRMAADIRQRLTFANTGPSQLPTVIAARLDGTGYAGANFREVVYLINVDKQLHRVRVPGTEGKAFVLHPVHLHADAADRLPANSAAFDAASGGFSVPARTAAVFVLR